MKTEDQIKSRLHKLYVRNLNRRIKDTQSKHFRNCEHNYKIDPDSEYENESYDHDISPRKQTTLIVINPQVPAHVCTFATGYWNGTICDDDERSHSCPYFSHRKNTDEVKKEFQELLADDSWVLKNFPDIAALQWVLEERIYEKSSFLDFFKNIIHFFRNGLSTKLRIHDGSGTDSR